MTSTAATEPRATGIAWATVQDVEDLIGPVTDVERCERLLERATGIVAAYICWPLEPVDPDLIPAPIREAVATMVARTMSGSVGSGSIQSEVIGGYSYRLAAGPSATDSMRVTPDLAELLDQYSRCSHGAASVSVCDCTERGYLYPPVGSSYAYSGPKSDLWSYLMEPSNDVGSPFNSGKPGRWWRERMPPPGFRTSTLV